MPLRACVPRTVATFWYVLWSSVNTWSLSPAFNSVKFPQPCEMTSRPSFTHDYNICPGPALSKEGGGSSPISLRTGPSITGCFGSRIQYKWDAYAEVVGEAPYHLLS